MLYSKQVSGLINLIFVMLVLGVVGGIATDTANTLRRQKNLTPDQMIKSVINMVVYIVIGLALLGAAYTVVA
jgi:p-aminobenzoyl-glutamate transporter AbgT